MGIGMGFVMSPMSTAAMNAVDPTKAGVASGMLSMSRMVGGTLGVAVHRRAWSARSGTTSSRRCCPTPRRASSTSSPTPSAPAAARTCPPTVENAMNLALRRRPGLRARRRGRDGPARRRARVGADRQHAPAPDEGVVLDASALSPAVEEAEAAQLQGEPRAPDPPPSSSTAAVTVRGGAELSEYHHDEIADLRAPRRVLLARPATRRTRHAGGDLRRSSSCTRSRSRTRASGPAAEARRLRRPRPARLLRRPPYERAPDAEPSRSTSTCTAATS